MPAISIDVRYKPWRECSSVKSSTKVSFLGRGLSGLISEDSALPACPTGVNEFLILSGLLRSGLFGLHFVERVIAAPIVRLRT
jgi:hypothetical protein